MPFLKQHFDTEGPFGLPMKTKQARLLEARIDALPRDDAFGLRRLSFDRGVSELSPQGRCDVSWITEESPDRMGDVVRADGMDDSHFRLNPMVTFNHQYDQPPVGRSLWRRRVREGSLIGIKAKTHYPPMPAGWEGDWQPERAFQLVQAGLLQGKSIGLIPLEAAPPTDAEMRQNPALRNVRYIIKRWLLAEYACCFLPVQPNAVVEEVLKSMPASNVTFPREILPGTQSPVATSPKEPQQMQPMAFACSRSLEESLPALLQSPTFSNILEKNLLLSWKCTRRLW